MKTETAKMVGTEAESMWRKQSVTRESADFKQLHFDCGCRKGVCMVKGNPQKAECSISCRKCSDHNSFIPCHRHENVNGPVRDRRVIAWEYFERVTGATSGMLTN